MKTAFLSISILLFISCNSKSLKKTQREDIITVEVEELKDEPIIVEIVSDTIVDEMVTEELDNEETFDTILVFRKTPCFGKCPAFSIQLLSNGKMIYQGKMNVEKMGYYETMVNDSFIYTVFQEAEKIDFFNLSKKYPTDGSEIADLPKTIIFLKNGKKERQIIDSFNSPLALQRFEQYLQEKIDKLYWTKTGSED